MKKIILEKIFMQIKKWSALVLGATLLVGACGTQKSNTQTEVKPEPISDHLVNSTLWFQRSYEAKYTFEQAYRHAGTLLEQNVQRAASRGRRMAVIIDLDETVLDNSPYEARLVVNNESYNEESWAKWVNERSAAVLPGVIHFIKKAEALGVEVFYVSNRSVDLMEPTLDNLIQQGLPFADGEHILLKEGDSDKTERRERIKQTHRVVLVVGDQMEDFMLEYTQIYDEATSDGSDRAPISGVDSLSQYFVILPNPMYGSFERSTYNGNSVSEAEKMEYRKRALNVNRKMKQ